MLRSLCGGWADAQAGALVGGTTRDPSPGCPPPSTSPYGCGEACAAPEPGRLVVIDVAAGEIPPSVRGGALGGRGRSPDHDVRQRSPMAALGGGVFVALVRGGIDAFDLVPLLRREIDCRVGEEPLRSATRCPVHIYAVDVPRSPDDAADLLRRLARS